MSRVSLIPALALMAACVLTSRASASDRTFVLSQTGAALTEIDGEAGHAEPSIALDKAPAAVAIAPDTGLAYITHPDLGKISVVDLDQGRVLRTLPVTGSPFGIAVASGGRLFVGDWNGAHIAVIDARGKMPEGTIQVGRAPAHILLTPDGKHLFVANRESDSVSVVRTAGLEVEATIPVGRAPFAMALSPNASRLYVGNVQNGTISVIDTAALKVVDTLPSGAMPYGTAVTPDGSRVLVSNQQSSTIAVLGNAASTSPIKVGGYPEGIAINAEGTHAYVANWFSDDVSLIDLTSLKEIRRVRCPGGPRAIVTVRRHP